ncbi:MAG: hypothetical protein ACYTDV_12040 [Planctomycetota bacterium]
MAAASGILPVGGPVGTGSSGRRFDGGGVGRSFFELRSDGDRYGSDPDRRPVR